MDDDDDTEVRDDMLLMGNTIPDDDDLDDDSVQSDAPMLMDMHCQHQAVDSSQRSVTATNTALAKVLPHTYQAPPNHAISTSCHTAVNIPRLTQQLCPLLTNMLRNPPPMPRLLMHHHMVPRPLVLSSMVPHPLLHMVPHQGGTTS